jgi:hypothetical protein
MQGSVSLGIYATDIVTDERPAFIRLFPAALFEIQKTGNHLNVLPWGNDSIKSVKPTQWSSMQLHKGMRKL